MENINWYYTQANSDAILSDGIFQLKKSPCLPFSEIDYDGFGNYLLSHNKTCYYIGEGRNLRKRLKQQFKLTTSTFYKNLLKKENSENCFSNIPINSFKVQILQTEVGRKEIEEFGIANLSTPLNRFQMGKRELYNIIDQDGIWKKVQELKSEILSQAEQEVFNDKFTPWFDCKMEKKAGLYIVKDSSDKLIYIGESSNVFDRFKTHSKTTYFSALRRHIGTEMLNLKLHERKGKKKYFEVAEDMKVTDFLKNCKAKFYPVSFGRYELEEYLIKKKQPILNRKGISI